MFAQNLMAMYLLWYKGVTLVWEVGGGHNKIGVMDVLHQKKIAIWITFPAFVHTFRDYGNQNKIQEIIKLIIMLNSVKIVVNMLNMLLLCSIYISAEVLTSTLEITLQLRYFILVTIYLYWTDRLTIPWAIPLVSIKTVVVPPISCGWHRW